MSPSRPSPQRVYYAGTAPLWVLATSILTKKKRKEKTASVGIIIGTIISVRIGRRSDSAAKQVLSNSLSMSGELMPLRPVTDSY